MVFVIGATLGWLVKKADKNPMIQNVRETSGDYEFINPLLFVKVPEDQAFPEYLPLKHKIEEFIKNSISDEVISDASVYFRNLNSSQWISVNREEKFSPSSMLKVITLISTLRLADSNPDFLSFRVKLNEDSKVIDTQIVYPPQSPLKLGQSYTIEELLDHLIVDSDNLANLALTELIGPDRITKTYADLQLSEPRKNNDGYTGEQYSYVFRALYNGTYLSRDQSEKVLELLSRTNFTQGIVAGVEPDTMVAHKFGVRTVTKGLDEIDYRELHDCGIVYYPEKPYFICIMTRGQDFPVLESFIKDISNLVWEEVTKLD